MFCRIGARVANQRATVHDVARLAGLSASSVSRALTGARPVSPDVAERAWRAAEQLGYRPDAVARSLRTQATGTLGLVVADITNPFFPLLVHAVETECRAAGLSLLLADAQNDAEVERASVELLLDKRIDALLISPSHRFLSQTTIASASKVVSVVQLDRVADESIGFVRVDQESGVRLIVDHLKERGRRHLGFIGSDVSVSTSWERQVAFTQAASDFDSLATVRVLAGDFTVEWGREAALKMLSIWPDVDGIICANDLIALGARQALLAKGVRVPEDVAIAGFDDTIIASAGQLTSVRQPLAELARRGVSICLATAEDAQDSQHVTLSPELVIRGSTV